MTPSKEWILGWLSCYGYVLFSPELDSVETKKLSRNKLYKIYKQIIDKGTFNGSIE